MEDRHTTARAIEDVGGVLDDPIVLLEDGDHRLEVAASSASPPPSLSVADGARLEDRVDAGDRATLARARKAAVAGEVQRACHVRLGGGDEPSRWYEVRFLPGLVPARMVVLLRDVTRQLRLAGEALLLRRITELANAGRDLDVAAEQALADVRATMGWRAGRVLAVADGGLVESSGWETTDGAPDLADVLAGQPPQGSAVARAAVERAAPVISGELDAGDGIGTPEPTGATAVVALPIIAEDEVVRVLELLAPEPLVLDEDQRSLLAEVGRQLGSVMVRQRYLELLEASHQELERSNAELERFAYVASHDLQEPLRKIVGFTELLQDRYDSRDDDEREFQQYIVDSAHRLQRLIKDLLAFSRAGRREMATERVDLDEVATNVLADLGLVVEEVGANVEVGPLPAVVGDDGQLREVLQNLLANALKYRAEERTPVITITGEVDGEVAHVVVADNGIGVAPEHRDEVFEVFRRLHPSHAYAGTGLGLALVKRIVERHDGSIEIGDSPLEGGIAVHVTLPRHLEQH